MSVLEQKKIILGICGSIAAYKTAHLTRLLVKAQAEVKILMTPAAQQFITPLTLSTLAKNPVLSSVQSEEGWNNHVELGLWADAMVIAPITATTLAKLAHGICDNIITAVYLSARCPVFFAPAMDVDMWLHPATQSNVQLLQSYGNHLIPVGYGELASGLIGEGRMAEPETIVHQLNEFFQQKYQFEGKKILVTAGPTYEAIDPVRFIGNRSSGKMGIYLAEALAARGAMVELILGPSPLQVQHPNIKLTRIEGAEQMYQAAILLFPTVDAAIMAAAVADYRPKFVSAQKIKKANNQMTIELERTPDIAAALGKIKTEHQVLIGFALETNNELENAQSKLMRKNFDMIVLNSLQDEGAGFHVDTNKITLIYKNGETKAFELKSKKIVALDIIQALHLLMNEKK